MGKGENRKYSELWKLLLLFLLVVGVVIIRAGLNTNGQIQLSSQSTQKWQQPKGLEILYAQEITYNNWSFDYTGVESALLQSKISILQSWRPDSDTLTLLDNIVASLPNNLSKNDVKRLGFLLSKNLTEQNAQVLLELVEKYTLYQKKYRVHQLKTQQSVKTSDLLSVKEGPQFIVNLQQQIFGRKMSGILFSERNITMRYLNNRLLINLDDSLSVKAKQEIFSQLKAEYKKRIAMKKVK